MDKISKYKPGTLLNNRFEVHTTLFGGMGEVIVCTDNDNMELVVLKTYADELIDNFEIRKRFIREAETWINLCTPDYTLGIKSVELIGGKPYLLMQCCIKGSLRGKLINTSIDLTTSLKYAIQIILGMVNIDDYNGLVHRDLKPDNILFDSNDNVKITDLGLVKVFQENQQYIKSKNYTSFTQVTQYGVFLGTLEYAAPEQII